MDADKLEALEERVRRAVDLIAALRRENRSLGKRLAERERDVESARARAAPGPDPEAAAELERLRAERREVLARVNRMLGLLDEAATLAGEPDLLAAVDDLD